MFTDRNRNDQKVAISRALQSSASSHAFAASHFTYREMRAAARKDIWCECHVLRDGVVIRDGVIVNVSRLGVRVKFRMRGELPQVVQIRAPRIGLNRLGRVAWQNTYEAGLEFVPGRIYH